MIRRALTSAARRALSLWVTAVVYDAGITALRWTVSRVIGAHPRSVEALTVELVRDFYDDDGSTS